MAEINSCPQCGSEHRSVRNSIAMPEMDDFIQCDFPWHDFGTPVECEKWLMARHVEEPYIRPPVAVTCNLKRGVHSQRKGCAIPIPVSHEPANATEPYHSQDDMYSEDWGKEDWGKGEKMYLFWSGLLILGCVALLWALHHWGH